MGDGCLAISILSSVNEGTNRPRAFLSPIFSPIPTIFSVTNKLISMKFRYISYEIPTLKRGPEFIMSR